MTRKTLATAALWMRPAIAAVMAMASIAGTSAQGELPAEHQLLKRRYVEYLIGTDQTFSGALGEQAEAQFLGRVRRPIRRALAFDFTRDAGKPFRAFPGMAPYAGESALYSVMLQQHLPVLAFGYCVKGKDNPHYRNPDILRCYIQSLEYLHGRGIRAGMTFHRSEKRLNAGGAPRPPTGGGNLVDMELRMGSLCQSVLLMEPFIRDAAIYPHTRALVRHLEMLGRTSGHAHYYNEQLNPPGLEYRVQSDAIQNYSDTTLVSALLEDDPGRQRELLSEAQHVFTDSLKVVPGWADTIKPDFTGYHHRGIYGNAYTGGFIPQAAFGVHLLGGTRYAVNRQSVANLKQLILTYRLYCQKYAMPIGIRGRMPLNIFNLRLHVFPGILVFASALGLDDPDMKPVFARLWDPKHTGIDFLFTGGRGKPFRGFHTLDMLRELIAAKPVPEPDPAGFWYKPYGGLAIHRRNNWMAAVKGYSAYIWDYENGRDLENVYGQYFSHGTLTVFSRGEPVNDVDSGYNLRHGWDWYRMPGATAVHFGIEPREPAAHRRFSPETFLGGASCDGRNGLFGVILNQETFADGTQIGLRARKSVFFVDDLIVLLGSGISGGDGRHRVETTLFQSYLPNPAAFVLSPASLRDAAGNAYHVPDATRLRTFKGRQHSFHDNGRRPTEGDYAVAWFDHGLHPTNASYEAALLVNGTGRDAGLRRDPGTVYRVLANSDRLHEVSFPRENLTGYCFFEAQRPDDRYVAEVSAPCLLMLRSSESSLCIGLANPDLGLVDREDIPGIDFKFISRGLRAFSASRPRPVELTLKGAWELRKPTPNVSVLSRNPHHTTLRFACLHGLDIRVALARATR
jgi:hypothetical protein